MFTRSQAIIYLRSVSPFAGPVYEHALSIVLSELEHCTASTDEAVTVLYKYKPTVCDVIETILFKNKGKVLDIESIYDAWPKNLEKPDIGSLRTMINKRARSAAFKIKNAGWGRYTYG